MTKTVAITLISLITAVAVKTMLRRASTAAAGYATLRSYQLLAKQVNNIAGLLRLSAGISKYDPAKQPTIIHLGLFKSIITNIYLHINTTFAFIYVTHLCMSFCISVVGLFICIIYLHLYYESFVVHPAP